MIGSRTLVAGGAALALALVACDGGDGSRTGGSPGVTTYDSANVRVVRHHADDVPLVLERVRGIGVVDGDPRFQFHRVRSIVVTDDGSLWVVDGNASIRGYDADGAYIGSIGGFGSGPGEAEGYATVWSGGGRLLTWGNPGRLQLFESDGALVEERPAFTEDRRSISVLGHTPGGWVFQVDAFPEPGSLLLRRRREVRLGSSLNELGALVLSTAGPLMTERGGSGSWLRGNPHTALDPRGRVLLSDIGRYRVEVHDLDGRLTDVLERELPPRPVDDALLADIREGIERAVAGTRLGEAGSGPLTTRERAEAAYLTSAAIPNPPPSYLPFIGRLLVGNDGTLWVKRSDLHPRPGLRAVAHAYGYLRRAWLDEWVAASTFAYDVYGDVYGYGSEYIGTVTVPPRFNPMALRDGYVYGVGTDDLGVEYIDTYRLVPVR